MSRGSDGSVRTVCLPAWVPSELLHPPFQRSLAGQPACLRIHPHTSAPRLGFLLSQALPSPPPCEWGEQTFCTVYCDAVRSFWSVVHTREFYIRLCIFFRPVNTLILLSWIPLFVFATNSSSRRKSVQNMSCQMSLCITGELCCCVLRTCIFEGTRIHNVCIFNTDLHLWISMPFGALPVMELPGWRERKQPEGKQFSAWSPIPFGTIKLIVSWHF